MDEATTYVGIDAHKRAFHLAHAGRSCGAADRLDVSD